VLGWDRAARCAVIPFSPRSTSDPALSDHAQRPAGSREHERRPWGEPLHRAAPGSWKRPDADGSVPCPTPRQATGQVIPLLASLRTEQRARDGVQAAPWSHGPRATRRSLGISDAV